MHCRAVWAHRIHDRMPCALSVSMSRAAEIALLDVSEHGLVVRIFDSRLRIGSVMYARSSDRALCDFTRRASQAAVVRGYVLL